MNEEKLENKTLWIEAKVVSKIIDLKDNLDTLTHEEYDTITRFIDNLIEHQYSELEEDEIE